jgi:uncharacterized delta-60 repeat protein
MTSRFTVRLRRLNLLLCGAALLCAALVTATAYAATGQLDPTFNTTGKVLLPSAGNDAGRDMVVQPDGKIVVVGSTTAGGGDAMVWRYNTDGTPDMSFNAGVSPGSLEVNVGANDAAFAVALAPDNKIVVAGGGGASAGFVARVNTDGTLDTTGFGSPNGFVLLNAAGGAEQANDVVVQPNGSILAVGSSGTSGATIYRRTTTGAADSTCVNATGLQTLGATTFSADAVGLQSNGDILVAGNTNPLGNGFVVRLLGSNCSVDSGNYGTLGKAILDSGGSEQILGLAVQPDNKAVAVGFTSINTDGVVYRLNTNGTPDTSFDTDGAAGIDSGGTEQLQDVAVQADGKLVVTGFTSVGTGDAAVYRLLANGGPGALNGALDPSFDNDGAIGIDVSGSDTGLGVGLQADGKVVVAGQSSGAPPTGFVFRLQGDPPPPTPTPTQTNPVQTPTAKKCGKHKKLKRVHGKLKCVKKRHKH